MLAFNHVAAGSHVSDLFSIVDTKSYQQITRFHLKLINATPRTAFVILLSWVGSRFCVRLYLNNSHNRIGININKHHLKKKKRI